MSEEIFGDKSPHQVSVSEGSGNAGSSRGRSGKFKADTSRRINVDNAKGELVSRHINSDEEASVVGGLGRSDPGLMVPHPENGLPQGGHLQTGADRTGPVVGREGLSDRSQSVSEGVAEENRQALPGHEDQDAQRLLIQAQATADNLQALPETTAPAPNLARVPTQDSAQNRVTLPGAGARDAAQGPIIQADASHPAPSMVNVASTPASGPAPEHSNHPHSAPMAKPETTEHREGLTSAGHADHRVSIEADGMADRHVPLQGEGGQTDNRQTVNAQALQDHHEPVPGPKALSNVAHLPTGGNDLASVDIGHAQPNDGHENDENIDENEALAPTHMDGGADLAMAEVGEESHPAPQAIKLQADLWREGFRGRVAQIKEQVALIHENLDKLEK
jgi:hypothetical protein